MALAKQSYILPQDVIAASQYSAKQPKKYPLLKITEKTNATTANKMYSVQILYIDSNNRPTYRPCKIPFVNKELCGKFYNCNTTEHVQRKPTVNMYLHNDDPFGEAMLLIHDAFEKWPVVSTARANQLKIYPAVQTSYCIPGKTDTEVAKYVKMDAAILRLGVFVNPPIKTVEDIKTSFATTNISVIAPDNPHAKKLPMEDKSVSNLSGLFVPHALVTGFVTFSTIGKSSVGIKQYVNVSDIIIKQRPENTEIFDILNEVDGASEGAEYEDIPPEAITDEF